MRLVNLHRWPSSSIRRSFTRGAPTAIVPDPTVTCRVRALPLRTTRAWIALAKEIGLEGVDAGHLDASRNIENLGLLVGQLAYGSGFGDRVSLRAYVTS